MRPIKEIEYSFLGCIFDNPPARILEALDEGAKKEWFTDEKCRLVWAAIESIRAKKTLENLPYLAIVQEAIRLSKKKKTEFFGITISADFYSEAIKFRSKAEEGEKSDIHSYAEILRAGSVERRIKAAMAETSNEFASASNTGAVGSELANRIVSILSDETTSKDINVNELLDAMFATYQKSYEEFSIKKNYDYVAGIPMPWSCVSHVMNGLQPGLHIVAARPSVGKTSFVLQCIDYWCASGYKVVFNCLDMAVSQIIKRPAANLARVAIDRAERGMTTPIEQKRLTDAGRAISEWYDTGRFNLLSEYDVNQFKTWCTIRHAAGKLDIAVVDYAQQMRIRGGGNKSENDRLTQVSAVLKSIAVELGIPVIALSQLSRDNVKDKNGAREPTMADLRGSGSLEQDAFSITLLHKDDAVINFWSSDAGDPVDMVERTGDDNIDLPNRSALGAVWWIHCKNQNGKTGRIPFVVYQNHYRWYVGVRKPEADAEAGRPKNLNRFDKIEADWRFFEEPYLTLERNGRIIYPKYWPQKCARLCAKMGIEIPESIQRQLSQYDIDHYKQGIMEFKAKLEEDRQLAKEPINAPRKVIEKTIPIDTQCGSQGDEPDTDELEAVREDMMKNDLPPPDEEEAADKTNMPPPDDDDSSDIEDPEEEFPEDEDGSTSSDDGSQEPPYEDDDEDRPF